MLTVKYASADQGITVPYGPKFKGKQKNSGFVDLRGRADLAAQIPEASGSSSLKALLVALAESASPVFTVGCDLGAGHDDEPGTTRQIAGGYIQVMTSAFSKTSPEDYLVIAEAVSGHVDAKSAGKHWELAHVYTPVDFRLGLDSGVIPSLQIWFHAKAETLVAAVESREILISTLHDALNTAIGTR
jgi:hypothetical protein